MKKFFEEFKAFAMRGNVLDLAVGVIIGGAFQKIVSSLVGDMLTPLLGLFGTKALGDLMFKIGEAEVKYGAFLTAIIDFIVMAFVIFVMVKLINTVAKKKKQEEVVEEPTTKTCPYCQSEIAIKASRCPHCTSELE
ncbi:MAG: large conductance mechanosensitive channel protein MscL [Clostridia bacterium]|nr:large conductance mechanosensitive channel protein MscL [Clostridia bacterium]